MPERINLKISNTKKFVFSIMGCILIIVIIAAIVFGLMLLMLITQ